MKTTSIIIATLLLSFSVFGLKDEVPVPSEQYEWVHNERTSDFVDWNAWYAMQHEYAIYYYHETLYSKIPMRFKDYRLDRLFGKTFSMPNVFSDGNVFLSARLEMDKIYGYGHTVPQKPKSRLQNPFSESQTEPNKPTVSQSPFYSNESSSRDNQVQKKDYTRWYVFAACAFLLFLAWRTSVSRSNSDTSNSALSKSEDFRPLLDTYMYKLEQLKTMMNERSAGIRSSGLSVRGETTEILSSSTLNFRVKQLKTLAQAKLTERNPQTILQDLERIEEHSISAQSLYAECDKLSKRIIDLSYGAHKPSDHLVHQVI